jgi:hypothetical protein
VTDYADKLSKISRVIECYSPVIQGLVDELSDEKAAENGLKKRAL